MMDQVLSFCEKASLTEEKTTHSEPRKSIQVTIDLVRTMEDLQASFELRRQAFVIGKGVPEQTEFDGNDFTAVHILMRVGKEAAGTLRIRCFKDFAKMERLCISPDFRGKQLYRHLLDFTEDYLTEKGYSCFVGYILKELSDYWFQRGFKPNPEMDTIQRANLTLVPVVYPFKPIIRSNHKCKIDLLVQEGRKRTIG